MDTFIKRHVTREKNEEGMFERLQQDLVKISEEFGISDMEDLFIKFQSLNCNK